MIDLTNGWFEMVELSTISVQKKYWSIKEFFGKSSKFVGRLINRSCLSRYPWVLMVVYDNGSEFKLEFEKLVLNYSLNKNLIKLKTHKVVVL